MNPSPAITYELAQSRITDLRHQARRESVAHAARPGAQPRKPQVPGRLRLHLHLHLRSAS